MQIKLFSILYISLFYLSACASQSVSFQETQQTITQQEQVATPLGKQCPSPDATVNFAPQFFAPGLGQSPTWAVFSNNGRVLLGDINQSQQTEHGFPVKLLWAIEREGGQVVTVSGRNVETSEPVWFAVNGQQATTSTILDPKQPAIPFQREGYAEFPGYMLLDKPGCYVLQVEAATQEASWQRHFLVTK